MIAFSAIASMLIIMLVTKSASGLSVDIEGDSEVKLKVASVLFISVVILAGIARFSPELSVLAYCAFFFVPLQRLLNISIGRSA